MDFRFGGGTLADWLTLWPLPALLLTDPGDDPERIEKSLGDEASLFLERRPDGGHLRLVPILVRKVVNIRESIARQNAHLALSERQYKNLLQAVPDIVYMLDGQGRFIYLNDSVRSIGYEPSSLIGKHFSEIVHPSDLSKVSRATVLRSFEGKVTGPGGAPRLFDERRSGRRMTRNLELRLRQSPGSSEYLVGSVNAYGEVNSRGYRLPELDGGNLGTVGIIRDIGVRKDNQRKLEEALDAKETLLKEIHHRVKNNLQVISSLLHLQEASVSDESSRKVFLECQSQIQTMSMVHEELYRSGDQRGVEMQAYFERLLEYLSGVHDADHRGIRWTVEAGPAVFDLNIAIPVGLIANELASNSYKYAFPEGRRGTIRVALSVEGGDVTLSVSDDGVGLEGPAEASGPRGREKGIGTELVLALASQLRGTMSVQSGPGSVTTISFPADQGQ
jgi:PAS domain S-box-containing protein